jgi:predicted Zn-dependent protease
MECTDPHEGVPLMQWAATRALKLDPEQADAQLYAKIADLRLADKTDLIAAARRALVVMPQDAGLHNWAAAILLSAGKPNEALLHMRCAIGLQPTILSFRIFAATVLLYAGRSLEAIRHLRDILECDPDDYAANYWLSRAYNAQGSYEEAKDVADRAYANSGTAKALSNLGNVEASLGNTGAVSEIVGKLEERRAQNEYVPRSGLVAIHIASGKLDAAAAEAEAAAHEGDFRLAWTQGDPLWAPLRGRVTGL